MKALLQTMDTKLEPLRQIFDEWLASAVFLGMRLYMANIFFNSGKLKLEKYFNEGWDAFLVPFQEYHPIPGIPAEIAAPMATSGELVLSVLLAFGLFGRLAAAGLLIMTITIQYLVPAEYGIMNAVHYLWMFLFAVILTKGPGKFALDALLVKWVRA